MQVDVTGAAAEVRPSIFAGFPASSWAFAIRVWLATLLALYVGFWLELESPSSAAVTVAILALPTRGQGLEKAGYRLLATVVGFAASIVIAGVFSQTDELLLAMIGIWIGLCVYAAGLLDGNRAYAAALGCITVALIVVQQIDSPSQVFTTGVARGAAIAIGVLATALVNDVLAAPDYHPVLASRLDALYHRAIDFAARAMRGEAASAATAALMLRDILALRPEIASLTTESSSGRARSAAARSTIVDLVSALSLTRALMTLPVTSTTVALPNDWDRSSSDLMRICRAWLSTEISRRNADVRNSLNALHTGARPSRHWRAPLYRSRRIAAENATRAATAFVLIASLFVLAGWPSTELCLSLVAVIIGLSATAPDPRSFTMVAVLATPIACLLAGVLKYLVFNGVSEFQLLAIGLAPVVIGLALLISLPSRVLSPLGRLVLVFTLAVLAPSNPQSYEPEVFLVTCLFTCLASVLVFVANLPLPSLSGDRRLRLLLGEAQRELKSLGTGRSLHLALEEAEFRDASRIEQIVAAAGASPASQKMVLEAMRCFDLATILRRCRAELDPLAAGPLAEAARVARGALVGRNGEAIVTAAESLHRTAARSTLCADSAIATLVLASIALTPSQPTPGSNQGQQL
ncbi:FUSC family protein [Bradyrhizobium sp. HKCCYLS1011]|uniref:FUSC family protein n=1 Tax=Bradyrhizobium sp. HKCCYLS1011 TaxID=3420733 RepID=UPI003EB932FC